VRRILQEKASSESCNSLALVKAGATPPEDLTVPTPECDPLHRGEEIPMHSVAARLNARIPRGKQGHIGKAIKALYAASTMVMLRLVYQREMCPFGVRSLRR
jgi:hypothetical protein